MLDIETALRRALGRPVTSLNTSGAFHNVHFATTTSTGSTMFVKVFHEADYWGRAIAAADAAAPLLRTPRLLDYGELGPDRWWISYEWIEMAPFTPTADHLRQVGAMVGRLHAGTRGAADGFAEFDLDGEIAERAGRLAKIDAYAADRVRAVHARWGPTELAGECALIHGDFHWRNVGVVDGAPILFDLENVRAAPPIMDFGKLVDLSGLLGDAEAFFAGYEKHAAPVWPWPEAMRAVRLYVTTGVLTYSLAMGIDRFAAHGYRRLAELEAMQ